MVSDWIITYIGGGVLVIIGYVIVSNTFWLLLGTKALQVLPGVGGEYAIGTFKIAIMLLMSLIGFANWLVRSPIAAIGAIRKITLKDTVARWLQRAGRIQGRISEMNSTKTDAK